jgi:hypothetical protein
VRLYANAANDKKLAGAVARKLVGKVVSPWTAYRIARLTLTLLALKTLMLTLAHTVYEEEEQGIPESERGKTHAILPGSDADDRIFAFYRLGIMDDLLEWTPLDNGTEYAIQYLKGRRSLSEIAKDMSVSVYGANVPIKPPLKKIVSGMMPHFKLLGEVLGGRSLYPDPTQPREIYDRGEYALRQLGVPADVAKYMLGKPTPKDLPSKALLNAFVYEVDPKQTVYYATKDEMRHYKSKHGLSNWRPGRSDDEHARAKSEALYNAKMAIRYEDPEATEKHLSEYFALGGKLSGVKSSLDNMAPLAQLPKKHRNKFKKSLDGEQLHQLELAEEFWKETLRGDVAEIRRAAAGARKRNKPATPAPLP